MDRGPGPGKPTEIKRRGGDSGICPDSRSFSFFAGGFSSRTALRRDHDYDHDRVCGVVCCVVDFVFVPIAQGLLYVYMGI